ncbi:MAG: hypothetical protein QOJ29_1818 [Thermoleophilaceae bacterium]|nr:hypothetical protein [Thermoleophilaceae bacterium]
MAGGPGIPGRSNTVCTVDEIDPLVQHSPGDHNHQVRNGRSGCAHRESARFSAAIRGSTLTTTEPRPSRGRPGLYFSSMVDIMGRLSNPQVLEGWSVLDRIAA